MLTNSKSGVVYTNQLLAANNPVALIACLANENIIVPRGSTEILLLNLLNEIYNNEREKWLRIVKCTPFNAGADNWTTAPETINDIRTSIEPNADANTRFNFGDLFTKIGDFLGGSSTEGGGSSTSGNQLVDIVATIIVGAVAMFSLWLIFKPK